MVEAPRIEYGDSCAEFACLCISVMYLLRSDSQMRGSGPQVRFTDAREWTSGQIHRCEGVDAHILPELIFHCSLETVIRFRSEVRHVTTFCCSQRMGSRQVPFNLPGLQLL